ncbi:putative adhesin [Streptomyces vinaceus]|uniref:putative adhesin n=1 Tax=Streptomyces vinaceus TaxID=1960 RepID=UPI003695FE30
MGYVLVGHGAFDADPGVTPQEMEIVAIPDKTTIQFYAHMGQGLGVTSADLAGWYQIPAPWPHLDHRHVTYNLTLYGFEDGGAWVEASGFPTDGPDTVVMAGPVPIRMCEGTPETCPTTPAQVADGMVHSCEGILGTYSGDLHWVACTGVEHATEETMRAVRAGWDGAAGGAHLGQSPDRRLTDEDQRHADGLNRANLQADEGASVEYLLGASAFLVGDGHEPWYVDQALYAHDMIRGVLTVRGDRLDVVDAPKDHRDRIRSELRRATDARIRFVRSDWTWTGSWETLVALANERHLGAVCEGDGVDFLLGGETLLIDPGVFDPDYEAQVVGEGDAVRGQISVFRDRVDVLGVPQDKRTWVGAAVASYCGKQVRFTESALPLSERNAVAAVNRRNIDRARSGQTLPCLLDGALFLVGSDHDERYDGVPYAQSTTRCLIRVHTDRLALRFVPADRQDTVRAALALCSDLEVQFDA